MKYIPNIITFTRILLIPFYILPFLNKYIYGSKSLIIGFGLFLVLSITDFIDGYLARKNNWVTELGKFLDPLADKLLVYSAFFLLVYLERFPLWVIILLLVREVFVTIHRSAAMEKGVGIAAAKSGKIKTTVQMITIIVGFINYIFMNLLFNLDQYLIYLVLGITIYSGIDYFLKNHGIISFNSFKNKIYDTILSLFSVGKLPLAPGTYSSILTVIIFYLLHDYIYYKNSGMILYLIYAITFILFSLMSDKSKEIYGVDDSKIIVIDELYGQLLPLIFIPKSIGLFLLSFFIFRVFDILKPFPVNLFDRIKNGWGIMLDDFVSGVFTLIFVKFIIMIT